MRILGSVALPVLFRGDARARAVETRVVEGLPYAFIVGADFFRKNGSLLDFRPGMGFRPVPSAPWVPFLATTPHAPAAASPLCIARDRFCLLTTRENPPLPERPRTPTEMPSYEDIAWEDDVSFEWDVRHVPESTTVEGFTTRAVEAAAVGPQPQDRQLVMILPTERFDLERDAVVGVARAVMWWTPGSPVYCKLVNRGKGTVSIEGSRVIARMVALNVRDQPGFESLFDTSPAASDPPLLPRETAPPRDASAPTDPSTRVRVEDVNMGTLGSLKKQQLVEVLAAFIEDGLFPIDPKRVPACMNGELELPLINEFCTPFAAKQRRFSPEERRMIRAEIQQLVDRGVIRCSISPWAAQCLCVKKKDGTLRLCIDWRELNKLLVSDSGGLGDMHAIFDGLKGKKYFTQLDLASGFHQMEIAEKDRYKTAFRDADGMLWEFTRAGFGLTVLPAAFTRRVKSALGHLPGVFSWLDDILIASDTWEEHLATLTLVLTRLLAAGLSVNFAKCIFGAASQEFLGMIVDRTGLYPAPSKLVAIARMPRPHTVEELRTFLGLTGYLRQFVPNYSLTAAPLTNILRNKAFASKRARKLPIPWTTAEQDAFHSLRGTLASPTVLAFPDLERPFELHTDASSLGVGASLMQTIEGVTRAVAFASHRFSRTDARRGPTERECMGVLWSVDHFRPYLAGRQFKLVTDCSALTWLFRSRELCPKLHRWALRLMEYDMVLEWKAGVEHVVPDALSRLPVAGTAGVDVDDSFPDDSSFAVEGASAETLGPELDGVRLADLDPTPTAQADDAVALAPPPPPAPGAVDSNLSALRVLPFAMCAVLDAEPRGLRRSGRTRTPSVRLQPIGDAQLPPVGETRLWQDEHVAGPTPVDAVPPAPPLPALPPSPVHRSHDDIGEVLAARGEVPRSSAGPDGRGTSAIDRAAQVLTRPSILAQRQRDDTLLGQVRKSLSEKANTGQGGRVDKRYDLGADEVIRYDDGKGRKLPAIPDSMVADIIALVHTMHGHAGIGATLSLLRDHFHWPTMTRDTRQYVLSCSCRRRKRPQSRRVAMMPGRPLEPWDELQIDILKIDTPSLTGNNYILLVVDRASKFPFGFPLETKQAVGVARVLVELCLTFGVPRTIRCDGGSEFGAEVVKHLCRWLRADIVFGAADHPRGQGSVERLGGWLQELLAELCRSWPDRWDEYVSPSIWIKRTLPDTALPSHMTPFELLFGRKPRTTLDSLVPLTYETDTEGGLDNFVERRKQNLREVRLALERRHEFRVAARAKANATIERSSAGVAVGRHSLVLVRETESRRHRDRRGRKLQHDLYTGPWKVTDVIQPGLSVEVSLHGRKKRCRRVSTADVKPFHLRPPSLRHSIADEFATYAWGPDFKLPGGAAELSEFVSIADCRRSRSGTRLVWEYKGKSGSGAVSDWLSEEVMLQSFTPLQLDGFVALWHLYHPQQANDLPPVPINARAPPSRAEALKLFPIGFTFWKELEGGVNLRGQVFDFLHPYWRVRYSDQNWEELSRRELERLPVCR